MATKIARCDAVAVQQVTTATPVVANNATYSIKVNGKTPYPFTADASATAQEIVEGLQPLLDANDSSVPEFAEMTWTEDDAKITATGLTTGKPFTLVDASSGGGSLTLATPTTAKSPNHWIAENFDTLTLPANGDDVILQGLSIAQGFYWGLDQSAVTLASLDIRADSEGEIGLPEINRDNQEGSYYQTTYRDTHLKIGASILTIGDGTGLCSRRIKINLGAVACAATIYRTSTNPADVDEAAVHLAGGTAGSSIQVLNGTVDLAMLPGFTGNWGTIVTSGNSRVRCGAGVTLATIEASGNSRIETRSAVVTYRLRDSASILHIGASNITTLDHQSNGTAKIAATGALTIAALNGYANGTLDLTDCDSNVTITASTIYATTQQPFKILDPNNKLVMAAAASTPNGAQSLVVKTGSGRNVRIT